MSGYINTIPALLLVFGIFEGTTPFNTEGHEIQPGSDQDGLHRRSASVDLPGADSMFVSNSQRLSYREVRNQCIDSQKSQMLAESKFVAYKSSRYYELSTTSKRLTGYRMNSTHWYSSYFDEITGIFKARVTATHKFRLSYKRLELEGPGNVTWYLCGDNGTREKQEVVRTVQDVNIYNMTVLQCKAGDKIWLEAVASEPGVMLGYMNWQLWTQ